MPTLGEKLGLPSKPSPLLEKAKNLDLSSPDSLERLAVARGCNHYSHPEMPPPPNVSEIDFSNEELAIALLSPALPYSAHTIRVGAMMLSAADNEPTKLARLTIAEGAIPAVHYIANAALKFEPDNPFWPGLLSMLPDSPAVPDGVMPHPTRFVSMWGMMRGKVGKWVVWLRPSRPIAPVNG
jgi:hypothetical protein